MSKNKLSEKDQAETDDITIIEEEKRMRGNPKSELYKTRESPEDQLFLYLKADSGGESLA